MGRPKKTPLSASGRYLRMMERAGMLGEFYRQQRGCLGKEKTMTRPRPRQRPTPGKMNRLEEAYASRLTLLQQCGEIGGWRYEAIKLQLAKRTWYLPDFFVMGDECFEMHEVKGHWEDDARVKWKVAGAKYPEFKFVAVTFDRAKGWKYEVYGE